MHKMRPFHLFPNSILVRYPRAHNFVLNPNTILQEIHNKKCHRLDLNQNSLASTQLRLHFYGYNLPSKMSSFLTGWSHHNFRFCGWILTSGIYLTRYLPILRPRKRPKILWKITFETFFSEWFAFYHTLASDGTIPIQVQLIHSIFTFFFTLCVFAKFILIPNPITIMVVTIKVVFELW